MAPVAKALKDAGLSVSDEVILVGGSTVCQKSLTK
jgi:molecular chaperone DnaK (HSP70)